jgi:histone H3/H4
LIRKAVVRRAADPLARSVGDVQRRLESAAVDEFRDELGEALLIVWDDRGNRSAHRGRRIRAFRRS